MCSAADHRDDCSSLLAEFFLGAQEPCVPGLDAILVELRGRLDVRSRPWTEGVDVAVKAICARSQ